jgi:hypothetical protein
MRTGEGLMVVKEAGVVARLRSALERIGQLEDQLARARNLPRCPCCKERLLCTPCMADPEAQRFFDRLEARTPGVRLD